MRAQARDVVVALALAALTVRQLSRSFQFGGGSQAHSDHALQQQQGSSSHTKTRATFLGMDLTHVPEALPSVVHCVGENFLPKISTGYRSCQFRQLCWDLEDREFVIVQSEQHQHASHLLSQMTSRYARTSFNFNTTVSTSGTTEARLREGSDPGWFPRIVPMDSKGFYQLPQDVVIVPVEFPEDGSMQLKDILFDFFFPIYNLRSMFDLQGQRLLLANLRPSCLATNRTTCYKDAMHFMPLMNQDPKLKEAFMTMDATVEWANASHHNKLESNRICAQYGAAGIGALTGKDIDTTGAFIVLSRCVC